MVSTNDVSTNGVSTNGVLVEFVDRINIPGPLCWIPKVLKIGETHFLFCLLFDTVHDEAKWTKLTNFVQKLNVRKVQMEFVLISILQ